MKPYLLLLLLTIGCAGAPSPALLTIGERPIERDWSCYQFLFGGEGINVQCIANDNEYVKFSLLQPRRAGDSETIGRYLKVSVGGAGCDAFTGDATWLSAMPKWELAIDGKCLADGNNYSVRTSWEYAQ